MMPPEGDSALWDANYQSAWSQEKETINLRLLFLRKWAGFSCTRGAVALVSLKDALWGYP